jgi:hypothetical protein
VIVAHVTTRPSIVGGASPGAGLPALSGVTLRDTVVAFDCARCDRTHVSRVTLSSAYDDHEERAALDGLADALCEGWALTVDREPVCVACRTFADCGVTS